MVQVVLGNLFQSKAQTWVNTVNTVGVMGKGVALEFRKRFPDMYEDYVRRCRAGEVKLGRPYLYKQIVPPWILNFPTKDHWRSVARLHDIIRGLEYLDYHHREWGVTSLAVPPLGCGQGGLEWRVVGPILYRHLARLDVGVELYAPFGTPHEELQPSYLEGGRDQPTASLMPASKIEPGWLALVEVLDRIEREPHHWPVGRIMFQKIAYFATRFGIPTGLEYQRGSYGPYADRLKEVISRLVNNGLIQENRLGRMLRVEAGPTFQDARRAYEDQLKRWDAVIDQLADLFLRLSTDDAEIAATVHFVFLSLAERIGRRPTERDVLEEVMKWKQKRRPPLSETEVARTIRVLNLLSWIDVEASLDLPVPEHLKEAASF